MKLFISYARVDKPYCVQIAETLDIHDVWFDQRLYAGQEWWKEILQRLDWCDGFVYLLSPESVSSIYCLREYDLAREAGKHIFPVLIHENTELPESLKHVHYADFSEGITPEAVRTLLNSIHLVERENQEQNYRNNGHDSKEIASIIDINEEPPLEDTPLPSAEEATSEDLMTVISQAAEAMENGDFDKAVYLLKQAQEGGHVSRFINLNMLAQEAEHALERQTYLREADREYRPIAELAKRKATRHVACQAFQAFQQSFPDYDPDSIAALCASAKTRLEPPFSLPLLEWCYVPDGQLVIDRPGRNGKGTHTHTLHVEAFYISQYPITNRQFQAFIDDDEGYHQDRWWTFSDQAYAWHLEHPDPKSPRFSGHDRPRETITWFEAMAFCNWLSYKTGYQVSLPREIQWRRAARGDGERLYPWGDAFEVEMANTSESKLRMTTLVMRYEYAASPFDVVDMAGNVWEWCLDAGPADSHNRGGEAYRAICGGSFISNHQRARTTFHFNLSPEYYYATIGFRIVININGTT